MLTAYCRKTWRLQLWRGSQKYPREGNLHRRRACLYACRKKPEEKSTSPHILTKLKREKPKKSSISERQPLSEKHENYFSENEEKGNNIK